MKQVRRLFAFALTLVMAFAMCATAIAGPNTEHTVTVATNGNGTHKYAAYQVFVGNLDATGTKLADIQWGSSVVNNKDAIVSALKEASQPGGALAGQFTADTYTAAEIADILGTFEDSSAEITAFADIIYANLGDAVKTQVTGNDGKAEITVPGDGYYFFKDADAIDDGDTATKFILRVLNDMEVVAKDTVLTPDKEIEEVDGDEVEADDSDAAIGDLITFNVTIPVPDTNEYKDHFWFVMNDQLPKGMTFNSVSSVKVDSYTWAPDGYTVTAKTGEGDYVTWTAPANAEDAVTTEGGQAIKVVFKEFKSTVEQHKLIGKDMVITYTAYLNDDATYGAASNDNSVIFDYSNDPNHEYDGDNPGPDDENVTGHTPGSQTKTYVTTLQIKKQDENGQALAGATFQINGTTWNYVLETGEKFESDQNGTYYKLKDGSYTETAPNDSTSANYESTETKYKLETYSKVVKEAGDNVKMTVVSGQDGKIKLDGLKAGTYTVTETIAPSGYNLDNTPRTLIINWDNPDGQGVSDVVKDAGGFSIGANSDSSFEIANDGSVYSITVVNKSGTTLPSTGGIGTTIFYIVGGVMVAGAAIFLLTKRRVAGNE